MIIGVFGLSGVGKTTLVRKYTSANNDVIGFSASAMIKNHGGVVNYDSLTENTVQENQKILLNSINNYEKIVSIIIHPRNRSGDVYCLFRR